MTHSKQKRAMIFMLLLSLLIASACGSGSGTTPAVESTPAPEQPAAEADNAAAPAAEAEDEAIIDPLGKYDPPIEVTAVRIVNDTYKYKEGEDIDNNIWTRYYKDYLGITIRNEWVVSGGDTGEQKMNVTIASGQLPDIIPVNAKQLQQLLEADLIMDLTDIYDKYASPLTKEILMEDGGKSIQSAMFGGKLMALPNTGSAMDGAGMIWLRQDWLNRLNLPEPRTMDDLMAIAEAFTNRDPDGNNVKDTFVFDMNKDSLGGGMGGFFNVFHAYPNAWIQDASGNLVHGSIQPEVKQALTALRDMYAAGMIDREFGVKDGSKANEAIGAGKNGLIFGPMWKPLSPLVSSFENEGAQWQSYPLVSIDDQPAKAQVGLGLGGYFAVRKDAKHPEAAVKMLNLWLEVYYGKLSETWAAEADHAIEEFKYGLVQASKARKNLDNHLATVYALRSGDTSQLNPEQQTNFELIKSYLDGEEGPGSRWAYERIFGETGSFAVIKKYVDENLFMSDEFTGAPTPTLADIGSTLNTMQLEVFTKIVQGAAPVSDFDQFVSDWKKVGGDAITQEVNAWYKAKME